MRGWFSNRGDGLQPRVFCDVGDALQMLRLSLLPILRCEVTECVTGFVRLHIEVPRSGWFWPGRLWEPIRRSDTREELCERRR